jgi:phenylpropionate dioxygenase-like ring-hydroxylating dioxygenase large terminal subunit
VETSIDPFVRNQWHVLGAIDELRTGFRSRTRLLGVPLRISDDLRVTREDGAELPVLERFGYLWTTLGAASADLFAIDESAESDRRCFNAASLAVRTSAGRAVENFFDFSHFAFVHPGYLGDPAHAAIPAYDVASGAREIVATHCRSYQPRAAAMSNDALDVEYEYRVPHPFCVLLYKTNPAAPTRRDVIGLFVQPLDEECVAAHMFLSLLDDVMSDAQIRAFQQTIFGQDKPILENQRPLRLPLDLRAELPVRCDALSIAYRRWLHERGVTYGVIPIVRPEAGSRAVRPETRSPA